MNLHDISKFRRIPWTGPRQDPAYLHSESYAPQRVAKANIGHRSCSVAVGALFPMFRYGMSWHIYDGTLCFGILSLSLSLFFAAMVGML